MRLIDAEPIKKFIVDGLNNKEPNKAFGHDAIEILAEIKYATTVDAVEVVRCKDCVHYSGEACLNTYGEFEPEPMFFCAYGERRDKDAVD